MCKPTRTHTKACFGGQKVVGETGVTIQLGEIRVQYKVLVCCGLLQQVLIGIDFLTVHKCILINSDTNTVYSKGGPRKMVFGDLDRVYTLTVSPSMVADIPCEFREVNDLEEFIGVLQLTDNFSERYSAGAFRTAMSVKEGRIQDRVFNCLNKPRTIYRCSSIGHLYP